MTSDSNRRHLKRPEAEGMSRSIEAPYQITPPKLQHFHQSKQMATSPKAKRAASVAPIGPVPTQDAFAIGTMQEGI
jgi:hypothetical protein